MQTLVAAEDQKDLDFPMLSLYYDYLRLT